MTKRRGAPTEDTQRDHGDARAAPRRHAMMDPAGDFFSRLDATRRRGFVFEAVTRCTPGSRRGPVSAIWSMSFGAVFDLACLHIIDHYSAARIIEERPELARFKVKLGTLDGWLPTIRKRYQDIMVDFARSQSQRSIAFSHGGDLGKLHELYMGLITAEMIVGIERGDFASLENKDKHVYMRFAETLNDSAKTQAQSRLANLQADKIKAALAKLEGVARPDGSKTYTAEDIIRIVDGAVIGEATP